MSYMLARWQAVLHRYTANCLKSLIFCLIFIFYAPPPPSYHNSQCRSTTHCYKTSCNRGPDWLGRPSHKMQDYPKRKIVKQCSLVQYRTSLEETRGTFAYPVHCIAMSPQPLPSHPPLTAAIKRHFGMSRNLTCGSRQPALKVDQQTNNEMITEKNIQLRFFSFSLFRSFCEKREKRVDAIGCKK